MNKETIAKLIKIYRELKNTAEYLFPGYDHSDSVLGTYMEISQIIMDNMGSKYTEIMKTNNGIDVIIDLINNNNMTYEEIAEELLK